MGACVTLPSYVRFPTKHVLLGPKSKLSCVLRAYSYSVGLKIFLLAETQDQMENLIKLTMELQKSSCENARVACVLQIVKNIVVFDEQGGDVNLWAPVSCDTTVGNLHNM